MCFQPDLAKLTLYNSDPKTARNGDLLGISFAGVPGEKP